MTVRQFTAAFLSLSRLRKGNSHLPENSNGWSAAPTLQNVQISRFARMVVMVQVAVESSTMVSVGYEMKGRILEIEFTSGAVYPYLGVPVAVHKELMRAESKGRYFNSEIRDSYDYQPAGRARAARR